MKLPNGYGSVYKLSGNRRKPWVARKTAGWNEKGQPKYIFVGYYQTRSEALQGLAEYNGYNLACAPSRTPLRLVYSAVEDDLDRHYQLAWDILSDLHDIPLQDLTLSRMQAVFNHCGRPKGTQRYMKLLLTKLFNYGVRHEMIRPEKAAIVSYIEISEEKARTIERSVFTDEEIAALWKLYDEKEYASIPLILLYTGMRVDELLSMRSDDVTDVFNIRKSKTAAGVRTVPVLDRIRPVVDRWKEKGTDYLVTGVRGYAISYQSLMTSYWKDVSFGHRTHDCRHTVATRLAEAGVDSRVVNAILGHSGDTLAESVYTHISDELKREALEKGCF